MVISINKAEYIEEYKIKFSFSEMCFPIWKLHEGGI